MDVTLEPSLMLVRFSQPINASEPMDVTESGMEISEILEMFLNALSGIVVGLPDKVMSSIIEQFWNTP